MRNWKKNWKKSTEYIRPAFFYYILILVIYLVLRLLAQEKREGILEISQINKAALFILIIISFLWSPDIYKFFKILFEKEDKSLDEEKK